MPIVQAPFGGAATPELVLAVARAGALGTLGATWTEPSVMKTQIDAIRAATGRPFAVNLCLDFPIEERLDLALASGVPLISLFWGDPTPHIGRIHEAGARCLATVGSAEEARHHVAAGVDIIVAQGFEAGGHVWGTVSTMALVPAVVDAVDPIPVIAAGGVADGRGLAASLALGAQAAWIGTRFLAAREAAVHHAYREALIAATETDTTYSMLFDVGWEDGSDANPHERDRRRVAGGRSTTERRAPGRRRVDRDRC